MHQLAPSHALQPKWIIKITLLEFEKEHGAKIVLDWSNATNKYFDPCNLLVSKHKYWLLLASFKLKGLVLAWWNKHHDPPVDI